MEWMHEYTAPVITGICLCLGYVIKNLLPGERVNGFIPLVMATLGCALSVWTAGFSLTPEILLSGLTSGLASTGLYEAFKNTLHKK